MTNKIDFVIAWVDGSDEKWQAERDKYSVNKSEKNANRYREWGTLKYWFRGVEKYASWVNKIYFVTWGHLPDWLDINNPKLSIVRHKDYIPQQYLPTFSSHTIELNFHRIKGLSEQFVYFNDDMYIINPVTQSDFFVNGQPCDIAALYPAYVNGQDTMFDHILLNDSEFFVRHFDLKAIMKHDRPKWLNIKYGRNMLKTMCLMPFPEFSEMLLTHQPASFTKSTYEEVWNEEQELLEKTCRNKFRTAEDVNQYIFRYWQIGKGEFCPYNIINRGSYIQVGNDAVDYDTILMSEKRKLLCLNDVGMKVNFITESERMIAAFDKKFPQKSSFEL
jgi:hypothetical protein